MSVVASDGTRILLTDERWKHIMLRHPELENRLSLVLNVIADRMRFTLTRQGLFMHQKGCMAKYPITSW